MTSTPVPASKTGASRAEGEQASKNTPPTRRGKLMGAHDNGDPAHICCRARSALSAYKEDKA